MILQQHIQHYPVIIRRSLHPDVQTTAPGRTKQEAIAQMFKNAKQYGYYDCTDVEPAPKSGSGRR